MNLIRQRLESNLAPDELQITDDSHLHVGHPGARGGAGHYTVKIISDRFDNLSRIKRHQLVYACVNDLMPDEIHALRIQAYTPDEHLTLE